MVLQARKSTGEALAQIRAEAANPKTDLWWGGTGDPFLQAAEIGLLQTYRPSYIDDLHLWSVRQYAMSGNMVGGFYTSAIGFGFNEELLKKKKLWHRITCDLWSTAALQSVTSLELGGHRRSRALLRGSEVNSLSLRPASCSLGRQL